MLVLFSKLNFPFEIKTANQPGFEPGSMGPKATTLNIKLHSIDNILIFIRKDTQQLFRNFSSWAIWYKLVLPTFNVMDRVLLTEKVAQD